MTVDVMRCKVVRERQVSYYEQAVDSPDSAVELLRALGLEDAAEEYFYVICLGTRSNITGIHEVSHGELSSTMVHPREVFKRALANNAYGIIVAHNHPSGDPTPSDEDIVTTKRLVDAGELLGIKVLDHIIIGDGTYESLKVCGYIK
jgi:DNA repair protein RadC